MQEHSFWLFEFKFVLELTCLVSFEKHQRHLFFPPISFFLLVSPQEQPWRSLARKMAWLGPLVHPSTRWH
jgi:hypothetical protein